MRTALREARLALGLTQEEVARRAGIARNYYTEIERGATPSLGVALRIAEVLDVDPRVVFADTMQAPRASRKSA